MLNIFLWLLCVRYYFFFSLFTLPLHECIIPHTIFKSLLKVQYLCQIRIFPFTFPLFYHFQFLFFFAFHSVCIHSVCITHRERKKKWRKINATTICTFFSLFINSIEFFNIQFHFIVIHFYFYFLLYIRIVWLTYEINMIYISVGTNYGNGTLTATTITINQKKKKYSRTISI